MKFALRTITCGAAHEVLALVDDDRCRVHEFLSGLDREFDTDLSRLQSAFDLIAEKGPLVNREVFRPLEHGLSEIKIGKIRVVVFEHGKRFICTHGFMKSSQKTPTEQKKLGRYLRSEFLVALQRGSSIEVEQD